MFNKIAVVCTTKNQFDEWILKENRNEILYYCVCDINHLVGKKISGYVKLPLTVHHTIKNFHNIFDYFSYHNIDDVSEKIKTVVDEQLFYVECLAKNLHASVNHLYDGKPYGETHLQMVVDEAKFYLSQTIPYDYVDDLILIASCWLHDTTEDCGVTYNDLIKYLLVVFTKEIAIKIADIVYALENNKGKTREERANDAYYELITETDGATFCKLCDRRANIKYSKENGSGMFEKYKKENVNFIMKLKNSKNHERLVRDNEILLNQ